MQGVRWGVGDTLDHGQDDTEQDTEASNSVRNTTWQAFILDRRYLNAPKFLSIMPNAGRLTA